MSYINPKKNLWKVIVIVLGALLVPGVIFLTAAACLSFFGSAGKAIGVVLFLAFMLRWAWNIFTNK